MSATGAWNCADWSAWYNDAPGPGKRDQELHVAAQCSFSSGSITWRLEVDNEGIVDDPKLVVLRLSVNVPDGGTSDYVEGPITWNGDVGPDVERVEIRGDANVEIDVDHVS